MKRSIMCTNDKQYLQDVRQKELPTEIGDCGHLVNLQINHQLFSMPVNV